MSEIIFTDGAYVIKDIGQHVTKRFVRGDKLWIQAIRLFKDGSPLKQWTYKSNGVRVHKDRAMTREEAVKSAMVEMALDKVRHGAASSVVEK